LKNKIIKEAINREELTPYNKSEDKGKSKNQRDETKAAH
jgi:hypothetical protein